MNVIRGGSRAAATSKMERFMIIVNYYHKALHPGCRGSPRSASGNAYTYRNLCARNVYPFTSFVGF